MVMNKLPAQQALELLDRDEALAKGFTLNALAVVDPEIAREKARTGDLDGAIELSRAAIDDMFDRGAMYLRGVATTILVESLLDRGDEGDLHEAQAAIDRLADVLRDPAMARDFRRMIETMPDEIARYKGLAATRDKVLRQLAGAG